VAAFRLVFLLILVVASTMLLVALATTAEGML
jgi:hypothetical protein